MGSGEPAMMKAILLLLLGIVAAVVVLGLVTLLFYIVIFAPRPGDGRRACDGRRK